MYYNIIALSYLGPNCLSYKICLFSNYQTILWGINSRFLYTTNPSRYVVKAMNQLKQMVTELFEQDQQINAIEKEIKVATAQYHHLVLKNPEKVYTDAEVMAIRSMSEKIVQLQLKKTDINQRANEIKSFFISLVAPLNGGRWVHETEDFLHPKLEFWMEDEELKYARLNGVNY